MSIAYREATTGVSIAQGVLLAIVRQTEVMDWIQIGSTFGIPVLLLFGISYFAIRHVWPFVIKRIEQNDELHRVETEKFLAALDKLTNTYAESLAARDRVQATQNDAIVNLANAIKALQQVRGSRQQ